MSKPYTAESIQKANQKLINSAISSEYECYIDQDGDLCIPEISYLSKEAITEVYQAMQLLEPTTNDQARLVSIQKGH